MKHIYTLNDLELKSSSELVRAFAVLPARVNSLGNKSGAELAQAFAALPASVSSLNLSRNSLYEKSGAELAQAFAALPASVSSLDLSGNYLEQIPLEQLNKLSNCLSNIETIILSESEIGFIRISRPNWQ